MLTGKLYETCREEIIILLCKYSQKTRTVGILFSSSVEVSITLRSGKHWNVFETKNKSIYAMDMNAKQINKNFTYQIKHVERIINHNHMVSILVMNSCLKFKY